MIEWEGGGKSRVSTLTRPQGTKNKNATKQPRVSAQMCRHLYIGCVEIFLHTNLCSHFYTVLLRENTKQFYNVPTTKLACCPTTSSHELLLFFCCEYLSRNQPDPCRNSNKMLILSIGVHERATQFAAVFVDACLTAFNIQTFWRARD